MPGNIFTGSGTKYLKIVGGTFVLPCEKGTPNARTRDWELRDGTKGSAVEVPYTNWTGTIQSINFKETDYGEMCNIELEDAIISLNTSSRYFSDFACKVLSGDAQKPFKFHPYSIEVDGKKKQGISLQQNDVKLQNYFYDPETKKNLHGFPEVDQVKKEKKTYWKLYFAEVEEFLVEELKKLSFTKTEKVVKAPDVVDLEDLPDLEESLPF